ncbi:MAG: hypothetical protein PT118_15150 [Aphanizomenon gracile PMC644.10]|nr:hypothetical protein [Aphanizomenon gracile PMC638.10]MDM3848530.1 hypothetical protein [Aphanizomenon gracile PMC627.10]MDM3861143.1 hypothetical protein [Aphanizomenon gracile PMC644.10]
MSIWIVTTGNSDVQLKSDYNVNKWQQFYRVVRSELSNHLFEPSRLKNAAANEPYTVPARVMGMVYSHQLHDESFNVFNNLHFPLLDAFTDFLNKLSKKEQPDKIIVIITNQEKAFDDDDKKNNKCPYWQDTCKLRPILEKYFEQKFPRLKTNQDIHYLELEANSKSEGLDNWNECLILVNRLFQKKMPSLEIREYTNIFVSHQAGTPAISSAVQFTSLANFEKQIQFLVSNEYDQENAISIPSSSYLQGLKLQEAKELLGRYDYSGVNKIFTELWKNKKESLTEKEKKIKDLLAIAIQWNNANFDDFATARSVINEDAKKRTQQWWWIGYEAAYLAVIRLRQGNYVEALFHSFRAVEGLLRYLDKNKYKHKDIHDLVEIVLPTWKLSNDIKMFKDYTSKQRNNLFHNLLGLQQEEVFKIWNTEDYSKWQERVLGCINFISGQNFTKLQDSSLMFPVHEELTTAINNYELQN